MVISIAYIVITKLQNKFEQEVKQIMDCDFVVFMSIK